jgi:hypothetical protein
MIAAKVAPEAEHLVLYHLVIEGGAQIAAAVGHLEATGTLDR